MDYLKPREHPCIIALVDPNEGDLMFIAMME